MGCCGCFGFLRKSQTSLIPLNGSRVPLSQEFLLPENMDDTGGSFYNRDNGSFLYDGDSGNMVKRSEENLLWRADNGLVCREVPVKETWKVTISENAACMILRGMKTLHLRVQNQNNTALAMAQFLEQHPKIIRVYYPGLASHPEHHIAKRQMNGFGGVVSFEVNSTKKFVDSLKIPYLAPSFGGCESIVDQPAIMSYWDISGSERVAKYGIRDNLVRFSFGIEGFEDLKVDILQALEKI